MNNHPFLLRLVGVLVILGTSGIARVHGADESAPKKEPPFRTPLADARLEETLTERQAYSALCGIALHRFEKETASLESTERRALARAYVALNDYEKAAELYRQGVAESADDGWSAAAAGAALEQLKRPEEAEAMLREALHSGDPGFAVGKLAGMYIDAQRFEEVPDLVPALLQYRFGADNLCLKALCGYAEKGPDLEACHDILLQALEGVSDDYLAHNFELGLRATSALLRCGLEERAASVRQKWEKAYETLPPFKARADAFEAWYDAERVRAHRQTLATEGDADHVVPARLEAIVRKIEVQSVNPYTTTSPAGVLANMELKVGQPYAEWLPADDIRNLYSTGLISNVRIFGQKLTDGVKIIVVIQEELTR